MWCNVLGACLTIPAEPAIWTSSPAETLRRHAFGGVCGRKSAWSQNLQANRPPSLNAQNDDCPLRKELRCVFCSQQKLVLRTVKQVRGHREQQVDNFGAVSYLCSFLLRRLGTWLGTEDVMFQYHRRSWLGQISLQDFSAAKERPRDHFLPCWWSSMENSRGQHLVSSSPGSQRLLQHRCWQACKSEIEKCSKN